MVKQVDDRIVYARLFDASPLRWSKPLVELFTRVILVKSIAVEQTDSRNFYERFMKFRCGVAQCGCSEGGQASYI